MLLIPERVLPWLIASIGIAGATLLVVLSDHQAPTAALAALLLGLCATMTAAGLVAARSQARLAPVVRDQRSRPAHEELVEPSGPEASSGYLEGMADWAEAVQELIQHARSSVDSSHPSAGDLSTAADDTDALLGLLRVAVTEPVTLSERATLHAVCGLWDAHQPTVERLAAEVDPSWHRRWRARSVVESRLRHGVPARDGPATSSALDQT